MTSIDDRARSIFLGALERPIDQWPTFLDESCGDDVELRARTDQLLQAHQAMGSIHGGARSPVVTMAGPSVAEGPGTTIGPYKLLEQIGEGGMGVVFMAEQQQPVRRKVALKLIKPGMDTRQVIARFEAERQALAVMDHPGIARVLDAGATPSGHPYFVMELVRGVPINAYCDENTLPVRDRLELFATLCQAIQHAHTKGIIHRDIKPNNVLITRQDGRPVVKVIDFGVAKAMGQQLTEKTLFTNFAQMIGTPLYMSPEQAEQSGVDIDTRSDIYSLGVLLYELLTGSTPVDAEQLKQAAFDEIRRIIREDEPQTPSARISGSGTLPAIAAHRHIEPARLSKLVRGELDWIVMRALEKDRNRRYETANAFATDVLHYLNDEPVQACPPSATYRFSKFARRNRVAITTATLMAATLVLGTVISAWQAVRATRAERIAETARVDEAKQRELAETRQKDADDARAEAENQRAIAEANYQKAKAAVDKYFTLVSESKLFEVPGLQPLRKDLLESAIEFYEGAALERTNDPAVLADVAVTHLRVSSIYLALNRGDDFIAAIRRALDVVDRLRRDHPGASDHERKLAGFWKGMRWTQTGMDRPRDALGALQTGFRFEKTWQQLAEKYPSDVAFQSDLSYVQAMIGSGFTSVGRTKEGTAYFRKALATGEKIVGESPQVPQYRSDLAEELQLLARNLISAGDEPDEALRLIRRAVQLGEGLVAEFPDTPTYRADLTQCLTSLGRQIGKDQPDVAEQSFRRATELSKTLIEEFPRHRLFGQIWGTAVAASPVFNGPLDDYSRVENVVNEVLDRFETQLKVQPQNRLVREHFAEFCILRANQFGTKTGDFVALAKRLNQRASAIYEELLAEFPNDRELARQIAQSHENSAHQLWAGNQHNAAAEQFRIAVALWEKLVRQVPAQPDDVHQYAVAIANLARIIAYGARVKDSAETSRMCLRATEFLDEPLKADPVWRSIVAVTMRGYAEQLRKDSISLPEVEQLASWSTPIVEQTILDVDPLDKLAADRSAKQYDRHLAAETQRWLAKILAWTNRPAEAEEMWLRAIRSFEGIANEMPDQRFMIPHVLADYRQYLDIRVDQLTAAGQHHEAEELLRKGIETNPSEPSMRYLLAGILSQTGRLDEAESQLRKSISMDPQRVAGYQRLAELFIKQHRSEEAQAAIREAVDQISVNALANNNLAWFLATCDQAELRNPTLAVELARRALDLAPADGNGSNTSANEAMYRNTLGVAQYRAGSWEDAIQSLVKAEELAPDKNFAFNGFFLAMAHWQLGKKDEARKAYAKAVEWMDANRPRDEQLLEFRAEAEELIKNETKSPDEDQGVKPETKQST